MIVVSVPSAALDAVRGTETVIFGRGLGRLAHYPWRCGVDGATIRGMTIEQDRRHTRQGDMPLEPTNGGVGQG